MAAYVFASTFDDLNTCTKKDSYPLPQITRGTREPGRHWPLLLPGSEVRILVDKNGRGIEAVYCLHCG